MHALRLPPDIDRRLAVLGKKTGRSKSEFAREAILRHIEDIEDVFLARHRLRRGGARVSLESFERSRTECSKRRGMRNRNKNN